MPEALNAVIYARYSSDRQTEQSIEGQLRECYAFAKANDIAVIDTYIDRAISGKTDNRPAFQKMIEDSAKRQFQAVIVYRLDRFTRNRYDSAIYKARLKKNGVKVLSAMENLNGSPESIIMESLLEGMAEYYSVELSQKITRGMRENALKGKALGGQRVLGYKVNSDCYFEIDETTAPVVVDIFKLYSSGKTVKEICDILNARGVKTARGGAFNKNSLHTILTNKKYIGIYKTKYGEIVGGIPAIIDKELFEMVALRMEQNKKAPARAKAEINYLLSTKLFCGKCRSAMVGESGTSKTGKKYYYYACVKKKREKACDKSNVKKDWIEDLVIQRTVTDILKDDVIEKIADRLVELQKAEAAESGTMLYLENSLAEIQVSIKNIMTAIEKGIITESTKTRLTELEDEKRNVEIEIAKESIARRIISREQIIYWISSFKDGDITSEKYCQQLIDTFVHAVFVYDDKIVITYNYSGENNTATISDLDLSSPLLHRDSQEGSRHFFCFGEKSAANQLPISAVLCNNGSEPLRGWRWMCRAAIAPVTLADTAADGNPEWQNTDAEPAETRVFLLSYAQVMQYLPEQEQRKVSGTEYARSRGAKFLGFTTIGIGETDWWLRSPGKESYDACFLDVRGAVGTKCVTEKLGVRPALWMNLSADCNAFPYEQQVQAKQFAEQGDYAEATALLDTLGDYAGSAALAKEYRYQRAQAEAASGNYDAAIALYTELAGYADSDALCRASRYEKAVAAQEAGDYAGAMALFADAGQYADSMARLRECCKQQGISIYYFSADAVNAGVDTGYAKQNTISGDDKHFGWRLGRFFLTGFTRVTADENQQPVFIKTLGDSVTLWFDLEQDIDALNGNAQLSLAADANGYDQQFGIPKTNFGRGTLIVRHTDYQNAKNEPAVYTDYLLAKGTTGANTRIVLHEEGDYEVALDYEVQDSELTHITSKFGNYRIFLRFSIRNGNCMVYPFDLLTGAELQNTSVAEAGFSLDLARSRYLDINVRRAVLVETANGVIEDERFNRPAKDGDRYTQEGIYTISVSNRYTGESTTKTIFVGSQELLETYVRNGFSLERLK